VQAFGVPANRIVVDPSLLMANQLNYYDGMYFQTVLLHRNKRRHDIVATGGRYDRLIARFRHPTSSTPILFGVGANFALEKISANTFPVQQARSVELPVAKSHDLDVLVCIAFGIDKDDKKKDAKDKFAADAAAKAQEVNMAMLEQEQFAILGELWAGDIHATVFALFSYFFYSFIYSYLAQSYQGRLNSEKAIQLQADCRARGIGWMVLVTEKYSRKAPMLKVRNCNVMRKTDVDVARTELVGYLHRTVQLAAAGASASIQSGMIGGGADDHVDGAEATSEHVDGASGGGGDTSAPDSVGASNAGVNVQIVLQDAAARMQPKRKNMLISKAWGKYSAVRQQLLDKKLIEVLVVDMEQSIARRLLAIDVLVDSAFKPFLDDVREGKKYVSSVREAMVAARRQRHVFYVLLYNMHKEWTELYQFLDE